VPTVDQADGFEQCIAGWSECVLMADDVLAKYHELEATTVDTDKPIGLLRVKDGDSMGKMIFDPPEFEITRIRDPDTYEILAHVSDYHGNITSDQPMRYIFGVGNVESILRVLPDGSTVAPLWPTYNADGDYLAGPGEPLELDLMYFDELKVTVDGDTKGNVHEVVVFCEGGETVSMGCDR